MKQLKVIESKGGGQWFVVEVYKDRSHCIQSVHYSNKDALAAKIALAKYITNDVEIVKKDDIQMGIEALNDRYILTRMKRECPEKYEYIHNLGSLKTFIDIYATHRDYLLEVYYDIEDNNADEFKVLCKRMDFDRLAAFKRKWETIIFDQPTRKVPSLKHYLFAKELAEELLRHD